jgi:hypothetical protein
MVAILKYQACGPGLINQVHPHSLCDLHQVHEILLLMCLSQILFLPEWASNDKV